MTAPALRARGLGYAYPNGTTALSGVDLTIEAGELVADGPVTDVLTDPDTLTTAGLEPPAVVRLFDRLGWEDPPVDVDAAVERLEGWGVARR